MAHGKRYRPVDTGETLGLNDLAYSAYSVEHVDETTLVVNGEHFDLVTGDTDGE